MMDRTGGIGAPEVEGGNPSEVLAQADALRDQRMWDAAIAAYEAYLRLQPGDWRARVQLGHCVKESGDVAGALMVYREAQSLAPKDPDLRLQIGHALKLLGAPQEAFREYAHALALDPESEAAQQEVSRLGHLAQPMPRERRPPGQPVQIVFDASDLIAYFQGARAPTGIQRVQLNVIAHALLDPPDNTVTIACAFDAAGGFWREIARDLFLRLWRLSRIGSDTSDPAWVEAMQETRAVLADGSDFPFARGATLVNLGTSWWIKDYFLRVRHVQRRFGVRYVPFLHDCIPLLVPEHCAPDLVKEFAQWFASLAAHADAMLVNSECTAADGRRLLQRLLPDFRLPISVVRLDADARPGLPADTVKALPPWDDLPAPGEPFVLCVGTIESRKNHLLLFQAWLTLIRKHGAERIPRLVCVGKPGWLAEGALRLHTAAPELHTKVSIVHGVPDTYLANLYDRCLFTVYSSFYEGWGLPVTESLSYGRVPLVARNSALVEAGAEGAVFFEPQSEPDLVAKLEALLFDDAERRRLEERIARAVRLRSWGEIAEQILRELRAGEAEEATPPANRIMARPGRYYPLALTGAMQPDCSMAIAELARDGLNWHPLETWGVWTRPGIARLRVPLEAAGREGVERLRLYLGCAAPPYGLGFGVRALPLEGAPPPFTLLDAQGGDRFTLMLDLPSAVEMVEVEIDSGEGALIRSRRSGRKRRVGLGLTGFMVCSQDDLASRIEFLERQRFRFVGSP